MLENSLLLRQQLRYEVSTLEGRCASLLKDAKAIEDKVHQAYEKRVQEFKNLEELRKKIYEEAFRMFSIGYN